MTLKMTQTLFILGLFTACSGKDADDTATDGDTGSDTDTSDTSDTMDTTDTSDTTDTGDTDTSDTDTGDTGDVEPVDLAIAGHWTDSWGSHHMVDNTMWDSGWALYNITQFDNDAGWIVAQNDVSNFYNPELWSKFEWTTDSEGEYHYCQTAYDAADEQAAIETAGADMSDLAAGCGGFSWTKMRPYASFIGTYDDQWGERHIVSPFDWISMSGSSYHISQYDNDSGWIVAQNDSLNEYNPDLWSKFELTTDSAGGVHYCQSAYAESSEQAAIDALGADMSDLVTGCGGFGWTALRNSLPISGSWVDEYGGTHIIDAWRWITEYGAFHVSQSDPMMGWLVAQNDSNNEYNPDLWSKFEWTTDSNGTVYYCQSAFDAADEAAAIAAPNADITNPVTGCFGFPWTEITLDLQ